jgi:hypothetical protein
MREENLAWGTGFTARLDRTFSMSVYQGRNPAGASFIAEDLIDGQERSRACAAEYDVRAVFATGHACHTHRSEETWVSPSGGR